MTEPYGLAADFDGTLDSQNLQESIEDEAKITPSCIRIDTAGDNVYIVFDSTISAEEKIVLNELVGAYTYIEPVDETIADAIVDPSGSTGAKTIAEAFAAGAKSVYLKNNTYIETKTIVIPVGGSLKGESLGGVIITLNGTSCITTPPVARSSYTGTISITSGTSIITGSGTSFTDLAVGDYILLEDIYHKISAITSNTSLTIDVLYNGVDVSGQDLSAQSMTENIVLADLQINGNTTSNFMHLQSLKNGEIRNIKAVGCSSENIVVSDCEGTNFYSIQTQSSSTDGLKIFNSKNMGFKKIKMFDNKQSGCNVVADSDITDGVTTNCIFVSCILSGNKQNGAVIQNVASGSTTDIKFSNCVASNNFATGFDSQCQQVSFGACGVKNNGGIGIKITGIDNIVNGCIIDGNAMGIYVTGKSTISNNRLHTNTTGISSTGTNNTICDNYIGGGTTGILNTGDNGVFNTNIFDTNALGIDNSGVSNHFMNSGYVSNTKNVTNTDFKSGFKRTFISAIDPIVTNDITDGFGVDSTWMNITTKLKYTLIDDTEGAAIWKNIISYYGTEYSSIESAGLLSVSTGSGTDDEDYVQKVRLTTANIPAGDYKASWHYRWAGSQNNNSFIARVEVDDTTQIHSHEQEPRDSGTDQHMISSGFKKITLAAGVHTIDLDFKSGGKQFIAYMSHANLEIFRVV